MSSVESLNKAQHTPDENDKTTRAAAHLADGNCSDPPTNLSSRSVAKSGAAAEAASPSRSTFFGETRGTA